MLYFVTTVFYISNYAVEGIEEDQKYEFSLEFVLRILIVIFVIYFSFFEFASIHRERWNYLTDVFNYIDWASFILNFYIIGMIVREEPAKVIDEDEDAFDKLNDERSLVRVASGLAVIFMWIKTFYWMGLFERTSFYIRLIRETLYDIIYFLILCLFVMLCFGNALMIAN